MANKRYDYIDNSIAHAGELLDRAGAAGLVTSEEAAPLNSLLDSYFIPNVRHEKLVIPKEYKDCDAVPLVAMAPGERIQYGQMPQLSSQRRQAAEFYALLEVRGLDPQAVAAANSALMAERTGSLVMDAVMSGVAVKTNLTLNIPSTAFTNHAGDLLRAVGRPIVALQYFEEFDRHPQPATLLHETKHVEQYTERGLDFAPIDSEAEHEELLRDELAAYHLGHRAIQASFLEPGIAEVVHQYESITMQVEYLRGQYNSDFDPYEVSQELMEKLTELNLLSTILEGTHPL